MYQDQDYTTRVLAEAREFLVDLALRSSSESPVGTTARVSTNHRAVVFTIHTPESCNYERATRARAAERARKPVLAFLGNSSRALHREEVVAGTKPRRRQAVLDALRMLTAEGLVERHVRSRRYRLVAVRRDVEEGEVRHA